MTRADAVGVLDSFLQNRCGGYSRSARLVLDLGLDSQDLVRLILEVEGALGQELDEALALFADGTVGEICDQLSDLGSRSDT